LKLNDLVKEGQKLFLEDRISFGHAVILARLDKKQQKDILANHLFTYQDEPVPVRELSEYVRHYLYLDLGNVPWAVEDADLLREVGACSSCPKRTGSNPSLFTDMQINICTDRCCFEKKMQAHVQQQIESRPGLLRFSDYPTNHRKDASVVTGATSRRIWGKEDKCTSAEEAIGIDGSERGKIFFVCRNRECPKHAFHSNQTGNAGTSDADARRKHRIEKTFRQRLFSEIRNKVNSLPGDQVTRIVARAMWRRAGADSKRALLKAAGHDVPRESIDQFGDRLIEKANPVELGRMMVCMAIADELLVASYQAGKPETMLKLADVFGIEIKEIRDGVRNETKPGSKQQRNHRKAHSAA